MLLRRLLAILMILASCIAIDTGPPALADTTAPKYISSFTGKGTHVNEQIASLIEQAGKGDTVQIALYYGQVHSSDPPAILTAIKKALSEGAKVEIITEGRRVDDTRNKPDKDKSRENARLSRKFFVDLEIAGADVYYCNDGCIRSSRPPEDTKQNLFAINHHKFFLLDFAEPSKHKRWKRIVIQSSANVHEWGNDAFEQAVAFDATFYDNVWTQYSTRFAEMKANWRDGNDSLGMVPPTKWRQVTAFIGPYSAAQQAKGQDEYLSALNRIKSYDGCRISIVMGHWTDNQRSRKIVDRLNYLTSKGCSVDAIGGAKEELDPWGARAQFELEFTPNVHAKFMLLRYYDPARAKQGKDPWRKLTYAGSHNLTKGSWAYDDDAFLRIDEPQIYDDFCKYFDTIERVKDIDPKHPHAHYGKLAEGRCVDFK